MKSFEKFEKLEFLELVNIFQSQLHPERDDAFFVLVERCKMDFLKICEVRCKRFGQSDDVALELFDNVFKAYARKPNFDISVSPGKTPYYGFLGFLGGVAKNELTNIYRIQKKKKEGKWSDGEETIVTSLPPLGKNPSLKSQIIYRVISELPYSHRVIYCTYKSYENAGCNLPNKLLKELREHLGIKQTTVRSYKKEALDKIKIALLGIEIVEDGTI